MGLDSVVGEERGANAGGLGLRGACRYALGPVPQAPAGQLLPGCCRGQRPWEAVGGVAAPGVDRGSEGRMSRREKT